MKTRKKLRWRQKARKRVFEMEQEMQKLRASKDEELKQLRLGEGDQRGAGGDDRRRR